MSQIQISISSSALFTKCPMRCPMSSAFQLKWPRFIMQENLPQGNLDLKSPPSGETSRRTIHGVTRGKNSTSEAWFACSSLRKIAMGDVRN